MTRLTYRKHFVQTLIILAKSQKVGRLISNTPVLASHSVSSVSFLSCNEREIALPFIMKFSRLSFKNAVIL